MLELHKHSLGLFLLQVFDNEGGLWTMTHVQAGCTVSNQRKWQGQGTVILPACLQVSFGGWLSSVSEAGRGDCLWLRGLWEAASLLRLLSELFLVGSREKAGPGLRAPVQGGSCCCKHPHSFGEYRGWGSRDCLFQLLCICVSCVWSICCVCVV